MSKLEQIKKDLQDVSKCRTYFLIFRSEPGGPEICRAERDEISRHGGLENYLKHLHTTKNINTVTVDPRRKNGSTHVPKGKAATLQLGNATATSPQPKTDAPTVNYPEQQVPGLMGIGLGQYMEAHSSMRALETLQRDYAELKIKYETLTTDKERFKDECTDLKRQNDRLEDRVEKKSILDGIDINQALPVLIGLLKPTAAPGLNAPAQKQLSPIKEGMRQTIEHDAMPDVIVEKAYTAIQHYANGNEKFVKEFEGLLATHNLKNVNNG